MPTIDEKRVYDDKTGKTTVFVATAVGVVVVDISDDLVGGFRLDHRCVARDVASTVDRVVVVATDDDVLVRSVDDHDAVYASTGFGPAVAVGVVDGALLAADPDGRIAHHDAAGSAADVADGGDGAGGWTTLGSVEEVRAIDGGLVAAADGVYRAGDGLSHAGLDDVRDVAAATVPLAATGTGLYRLGNGWMDVFDGPFDLVSAAADGRAHAAGARGTFERTDSGWARITLPTDEPLADVAYAPGVNSAVTLSGTMLLQSSDGGWRSQVLGLRDVAALTIPPTSPP